MLNSPPLQAVDCETFFFASASSAICAPYWGSFALTECTRSIKRKYIYGMHYKIYLWYIL